MDKETLSNYGWVVIVIIILVIMIALATPFGGYISEAVMSSAESLKEKQNIVFEQELNVGVRILAVENSGAKVDAKNKILIGVDTDYDVDKFDSTQSFFVPAEGYSLVWDVPAGDEAGTGSVVTIKDEKGISVDKYTFVMMGDIDGDSIVSLSDAVDLKEKLTNKKELTFFQKLAGDVNLNGKIDNQDIYLIKEKVIGSNVNFPLYPLVNEKDMIYVGIDVVAETTADIDFEHNYILGISPNETNIDLYFKPKNGYKLVWNKGVNEYYGTGATVSIQTTEGKEIDKYTLILFGDINGDGNISMSDYADVGNGIPENAPTYVKIAADVNFDGEINSTDANLIKDCVTGGTLPQVPSK